MNNKWDSMNSNYYSKSKHESWLLCCFVMAFWRPWCAVMVYLIHNLEIGACTDVGQAARSDTAARVWKTLFNALHWCFMILVQSCAILYKSCMHSFMHACIHSFLGCFISLPFQDRLCCSDLVWLVSQTLSHKQALYFDWRFLLSGLCCPRVFWKMS